MGISCSDPRGEGRSATVEVPRSAGGDARGGTPTQYVVRFAGQAQYLGGSVVSQHKAGSVNHGAARSIFVYVIVLNIIATCSGEGCSN
jgi:hypothetical protein